MSICTDSIRTDHLEPGTRVVLPGGLVRTIDRVTESQWLNRSNEPIFYVYYAEGRTPEWSEGNSAIASTEWKVAA